MFLTILEGALTGASLIVAIGMQNIFVLTRGIKQDKPYLVAVICSFCDTLLIFIGALTTGTIVTMHPMAKEIAAIAGAIFLGSYGCQSLYSAYKNNYNITDQSASFDVATGVGKTIGITLGITLLNPHVYLDTVLLLGSLAGQAGSIGKYYFALGASIFSWIWFFGLVYSGRKLRHYFETNRAWRILDIFVCLVMWVIAASLVLK